MGAKSGVKWWACEAELPVRCSVASGWFFCFVLIFYLWLHWVSIAARAFSTCSEQWEGGVGRGPLFVVVHGLLIAAASLIAEHRL